MKTLADFISTIWNILCAIWNFIFHNETFFTVLCYAAAIFGIFAFIVFAIIALAEEGERNSKK